MQPEMIRLLVCEAHQSLEEEKNCGAILRLPKKYQSLEEENAAPFS